MNVEQVFEFRGEPGLETVEICGDFTNNWSERIPLTYDAEHNVWRTPKGIRMDPGTHQYKSASLNGASSINSHRFILNHNNWVLDPKASQRDDGKGNINSVVEVSRPSPEGAAGIGEMGGAGQRPVLQPHPDREGKKGRGMLGGLLSKTSAPRQEDAPLLVFPEMMGQSRAPAAPAPAQRMAAVEPPAEQLRKGQAAREAPAYKAEELPEVVCTLSTRRITAFSQMCNVSFTTADRYPTVTLFTSADGWTKGTSCTPRFIDEGRRTVWEAQFPVRLTPEMRSVVHCRF